MSKGYKNRQMETERLDEDQVYFFPKANPPVVIKAKSREEAEALLVDVNNL